MSKRFGFVMSLLAILLLALGGQAQVPNGGFEDWTAGNPNGWLTPNVPGFLPQSPNLPPATPVVLQPGETW